MEETMTRLTERHEVQAATALHQTLPSLRQGGIRDAQTHSSRSERSGDNSTAPCQTKLPNDPTQSQRDDDKVSSTWNERLH